MIVTSGRVPTYAWRGDGWVNGDTDATLATPPHREPACGATVAGAAASTDTAPGEYPDVIRCLGAVDANYDISYARASLRVDPVISLDARGLRRTAARRAYVDGLPVALPLIAREARFGSRHSYRFAQVVLDRRGTTLVTSATRFDDRSPTTSTSRRATSPCDGCSGGREGRWHPRPRGRPPGGPLARRPSLIKPRRNDALRKALHRFADRVAAESGDAIGAATADRLLAYAQAVYHRVGGPGTV